MVNIPTRLLVGRVDLPSVCRDLTVTTFDIETKEETELPLYTIRDNVIRVPRHYAKTKLPHLYDCALDRTVKPVKQLSGYLPKVIKPRNPEQAAFIRDIAAALKNDDIVDIQAKGGTGVGKTVAFLAAAAEAERGPILVIVNMNRVKMQWIGSIAQKKGMKFFFGSAWVNKHVGIIQQDVCDYEGRRVVIAMAPSLVARKYPAAFYKQFGIIVIDEVHKFAVPGLSKTLGMFPARKRVVMTATPKKNPEGKIITHHFGSPAIVSEQKSLNPLVALIHYTAEVNIRNWKTGEVDDSAMSMTNAVHRIADRQELLTDIIYYRGYARKRECLVLSDRTDQLLDFKRRLIEMGVPDNVIGVYVGSHRTGKLKLTGKIWVDDTKHIKHFRAVPGFDTRKAAKKYVEECIVKLAREAGVTAGWVNHNIVIKPEHHKPSQSDYDRIENECAIVLATYAIFDTAIDVSRLNWGLEASPRGDVEQAVGRTLRLYPDKPVPEWNSIVDHFYNDIEMVVMGKTVTMRYKYKAPQRLAKRRNTSYNNQEATIVTVRNPREAIQAIKAR